MRQKTLLVHNPISGGNKNRFLDDLKNVEGHLGLFEIETTQYAGHAREIARAGIGKYAAIGAVGGDGTVNEVASALCGSDTPMGIIPYGSGNGLANFLKVPKSLDEALKLLIHGVPKPIDTMNIDDTTSVNISGIGFDGHIAKLFNQGKARGLFSYVFLTIREYLRFKAFDFEIQVDEKTHNGQAFFIAIANSSQYGNNFHIAPNAKVDDGLIRIMIIEKAPLVKLPFLINKVYKKKALETDYCKEYCGSHIRIKTNNQPVHIDGETPDQMPGESFSIQIAPKSLQVIY